MSFRSAGVSAADERKPDEDRKRRRAEWATSVLALFYLGAHVWNAPSAPQWLPTLLGVAVVIGQLTYSRRYKPGRFHIPTDRLTAEEKSTLRLNYVFTYVLLALLFMAFGGLFVLGYSKQSVDPGTYNQAAVSGAAVLIPTYAALVLLTRARHRLAALAAKRRQPPVDASPRLT